MVANRDYLIELDSHVGDSDLGLTMGDGFTAASRAIADSDETDIGKLAYTAEKPCQPLSRRPCGTLMASGLMSVGKALRGKTELDSQGVADLFKLFLTVFKIAEKLKLVIKTLFRWSLRRGRIFKSGCGGRSIDD
jgi:dihydroxyacetone kinase-like protein